MHSKGNIVRFIIVSYRIARFIIIVSGKVRLFTFPGKTFCGLHLLPIKMCGL